MKILLVVPNLNPGGGITSSAINLCNELYRQGNDVTCLDMSGGFLWVDNLNPNVKKDSLSGRSLYWNLQGKTLKNAKGLKKLKYSFLGVLKKLTIKSGLWHRFIFKKYQKHTEFDVAIAFRQCAPCYSFVLNKVRAKIKIGFVHGELKYMGDISSWQRYMKKFNKIAYVSNAVKDQFVNKYPELKDNACTIYNMFDIDKIIELSKCDNPINFDKNKINIVTVARIENDFKRIDWIPEICKELYKTTDKPFHWYVVGGGKDLDAVKRLIEKYEVQDLVTMVGQTKNPYTILKDADFSVLLSKSEAYPMTVIESFILNVPIVVTKFASVEEMMVNGKHGIIVESNKESLIDCIRSFINDEELCFKCKKFLSGTNYSNEEKYRQFIDALGGDKCIQ